MGSSSIQHDDEPRREFNLRPAKRHGGLESPRRMTTLAAF
jgi:hypothetical protein